MGEFTDPRIPQLGLPGLMLQLDHPERPLFLMALDWLDGSAGLYGARQNDPPDAVLRVECWVETANQFIFTWRKTPAYPWAHPMWGEHSDVVEADGRGQRP